MKHLLQTLRYWLGIMAERYPGETIPEYTARVMRDAIAVVIMALLGLALLILGLCL